MTTHLESHLSERDRRDYELIKEFKRNYPSDGLGVSEEVRSHIAQVSVRIGNNYRASRIAQANADPNLSSLADEILRGTTRVNGHA